MLIGKILQFTFIIIGFAILFWRLKSKWNFSKAYVAEQEEANSHWTKGMEEIQKNPDFILLKQSIDQKLLATFQTPQTPEQYKITFITYMTAKGEMLNFEESGKADFLIAYLKGKQGCLQFAIDLKTKQISENKLSGMQYSAVVPYWAS